MKMHNECITVIDFFTFRRLSGLRQDSPPFGSVPGFPEACPYSVAGYCGGRVAGIFNVRRPTRILDRWFIGDYNP